MDPFDDPRFAQGVELFNAAQWYEAHDVFEALWHETTDPERRWLQGVVQIAVAMVHLGRGNTNGAAILLGEGLGRLSSSQAVPQRWRAETLIAPCRQQLLQLQGQCKDSGQVTPVPTLVFDSPE